MKSFTRAALLVFASAVTVGTASAQVTVGTPGAGQGNYFPFGQSAGYSKFQEFLSASYFTSPFIVNSVTFYRSANSTGTFQQGTYSLYLNTTTTTSATYNTENPLANEVIATRKQIGSVSILNATTTAATLTFTGSGTFNYNPMLGNLLIDVDFTPVAIPGGQSIAGRATFDTFSDGAGNMSTLLATASDQNVVPIFGYRGGRGKALVATFGVAAATVVPEPSSIVLMMTGLAGVFVAARRRKSA